MAAYVACGSATLCSGLLPLPIVTLDILHFLGGFKFVYINRSPSL